MPTTTPKRKPGIWKTLRNRIIAGLFVALPIFITYAVIKWLYDTLYTVAIGPIAKVLLTSWGYTEDGKPVVIEYFAAPAAAIGLVLAILFIAGMFFQSRLHRSVDWLLSTVPGINTVYTAVRNVFDAIQIPDTSAERFKRVVLIQFPHPGIKVPAFVTAECEDQTSGRQILCVYVPTTPIPTSGYMLMVPSDDVTEVDWNLEETLQAIVSGGITVPKTVRYDSEAPINIVTKVKKNDER